jgi:hypothetical protein
MKTHTPSPWLFNFEKNKFDSRRSRIEIVDGSYDSLNPEQGPLVLASINAMPFNDESEPLANALLISLAPDLLSALERLIHPMADDDDVEHARELIARAKGCQ